MRQRRLLYASILFAIFLAALLLRCAFSYHLVFQADGAHFLDGDSWFHMRTIENLLHHFPDRSGFDPFSAFPRGQPIDTGPLYDYMIGSIAWAAGLGSPGKALIEAVGAWFPAVMGALLTVPVFFLGRALLHPAAGLAAAAFVAVAPGNLLISARLGTPDHHVAEFLFSTLLLLFLILALQGVRPRLTTVLAGLAFGCFLATRPAGGFIAVIISIWAVLQCMWDHWRNRSCRTTFLVVAPTLLIAWLLFMPVSGVAYTRFVTLELLGGTVAVSAVAGLSMLLQARGYPRWTYLGALLLIAAIGIGGFLLRSNVARELIGLAERYVRQGPEQTILELRPLVTFYGSASWKPVLMQFGLFWILGLIGLVLLAFNRQRENRSSNLLLVWTAVMIVGSLLQIRMSPYASIPLALLAGFAAWSAAVARAWKYAWAATVVLTMCFLLPGVPYSLDIVRSDDGQGADWARALTWLRDHTPPPLGDRAAFYGYYPALPPGERFRYPPSAYGILNWWDSGHWISAQAQRIPIANGMQTGVQEVARFFIATDPSEGERLADSAGGRYVVIDPTLPILTAGSSTIADSKFFVMPTWISRNAEEYAKQYLAPDVEGLKVVTVFYPEYYRSMLARLYLFDGEAVEPKNSTYVIGYREERLPNGRPYRKLTSASKFETYQEARQYIDEHPIERLVLGGLDPLKTCVPLERVTGFRLVYESRPGPLGAGGMLETVKIFERVTK